MIDPHPTSSPAKILPHHSPVPPCRAPHRLYSPRTRVRPSSSTLRRFTKLFGKPSSNRSPHYTRSLCNGSNTVIRYEQARPLPIRVSRRRADLLLRSRHLQSSPSLPPPQLEPSSLAPSSRKESTHSGIAPLRIRSFTLPCSRGCRSSRLNAWRH